MDDKIETRHKREGAENGAREGGLLRTSQVAVRLGVDTATVSRYIREGVLSAKTTNGGHYRVSEADLQAYLTGQTRKGATGAVSLAIVNQKGGVGKTTATANLSVLLSQLGLRVLAVDLDPQGHLTWSLGHNPDTLEQTIYTAMIEESTDPSRVLLRTRFGPDLAPNNILASDAERLLTSPTWALRLQKLLVRLRPHYDYILMDSGPNLGVLTVNCMCAADYVLIPTQLEALSVKGLQLLLRRVDEARDLNPGIQVAGAVAMMVQPINANRAVGEQLRHSLRKWGIRAFNTSIKRGSLYADVANERKVMVLASSYRSQPEHLAAYRLLLAELLAVVGGAGVALLPELTGSKPALFESMGGSGSRIEAEAV